MDNNIIINQIIATWRRHQEILLYLLEKVPEEGLTTKPAKSRGRDVARQFAHMNRVRQDWLHYHKTGERKKLRRFDKSPPPTKEKLHDMLASSGKEIEKWLEQALNGETASRMFGKNPVRWMGYLIAHESHHRGQIMLALKQNGLRLPEKVAIQGLWGKWIFGKDE